MLDVINSNYTLIFFVEGIVLIKGDFGQRFRYYLRNLIAETFLVPPLKIVGKSTILAFFINYILKIKMIYGKLKR